MRSGAIGRLGFALALCALLLAAPAGAEERPARKSWEEWPESERMREVTRSEAVEILLAEGGPLIVDTRGPREFAEGHIPGAVNIPHKETWGRIDFYRQFEDRGIVLYCTRGGRASIAGEGLLTEGFRKVGLLQGHYPAWKRSGLPVAP